MDRSKYIASGLVAFDLRARIMKWSTHLDLSTDSTTYRAYAYSAPTLVDIDRDGKLEVIAGTSVVSCCLSWAHILLHHHMLPWTRLLLCMQCCDVSPAITLMPCWQQLANEKQIGL